MFMTGLKNVTGTWSSASKHVRNIDREREFIKEFRKQQNQEGGREREAAVECINYDDVMHIRGSSCL